MGSFKLMGDKMRSLIFTTLLLSSTLYETKAENISCEKAIVRCCKARHVQDLASNCFNRNNCPSLQWLGKNACLPTVVNAVMEKNSEKTMSDYNFKLKELSE